MLLRFNGDDLGLVPTTKIEARMQWLVVVILGERQMLLVDLISITRLLLELLSMTLRCLVRSGPAGQGLIYDGPIGVADRCSSSCVLLLLSLAL